VACALGWACWKTYLGRPEADRVLSSAMSLLGVGLSDAKHHEDALSVREATLSMERRLGASEESVLVAQSNLAITYSFLGRREEALRMRRDIYAGFLKLKGEEHVDFLGAACNYANSLRVLKRYQQAKAVLRRTMPVARRVLGESNGLTIRLRWNYAWALYADDDATLDHLREAVTTLEDTASIARRVLGGSNPLTEDIEVKLRDASDALAAREMPVRGDA